MYSIDERNVNHVKKYIERDEDIFPATSKSSEITEAQSTTRSSPSQQSREPVSVSSGRPSEDNPAEYRRSDDTTMEQSDSTTLRPSRVKRLPPRFQDYVLGCVQLAPD